MVGERLETCWGGGWDYCFLFFLKELVAYLEAKGWEIQMDLFGKLHFLGANLSWWTCGMS